MNAADATHPLGAALRQAAAGVDAAAVAQAVVNTWQAIDNELGPVIGPRGVAALYQHSLHRVATARPWLAGATDADCLRMDLGGLKNTLAAQTHHEATQGGLAALQVFVDLLTALVGAVLTERLLRPVLAGLRAAPPESGAMP